MKKLIYILLIVLLTGCSTFRLSTYYEDPVYFNGEEVEVIDNYFELNRKLRTDFNFRWDFAQYAMNQPLSWYYTNSSFNRIWRPYNRFDIWLNSTDFWYDWAFNYNWNWNNWHWGSWNYPYHYGWNRPYSNYYYWNYGWNNWRWNMNDNAWRSRVDNNVVYVNGRRGSRNSVVVTPTGTVGRTTVNIDNINVPRLNNRIPTPDDVDIVIERSRRNIFERTIDKLEDKGIRIRTYNNPNNFKNDQIIRPNTRGDWRTESGNYGGRSWSRENVPTQTTPIRQFTPIQSGQVRGGSRPSVPQQTRSSVNSSSQGRSSSGRIQN